VSQFRIVDAGFLTSAQSLKDSPSPDRAEIAFLGRSNVGKSSLLNSLSKRKNLAKSSSTPGKTQLINYFDITFKHREEGKEWHKNLTDFLEQRPSLQIFVHLIDARHSDLEIDKSVNEFLHHIKKGDQIIINAFTKIDKLNQSELQKLRNKYPTGIYISNLKNRGIDKLESAIASYLFEGTM